VRQRHERRPQNKTVTDNELTAIAYEITEIRKLPTALKCTPLEVRKVREKLHDLALGAQCGPSGWRSYLLQAIGEQEGGHVAIATWQNLWPRGKLQPDVIELFTAATVTPVDGGFGRVKETWQGSKKHANSAQLRVPRSLLS
jgi:hypothetical protein